MLLNESVTRHQVSEQIVFYCIVYPWLAVVNGGLGDVQSWSLMCINLWFYCRSLTLIY